jgi:hypothetical protein
MITSQMMNALIGTGQSGGRSAAARRVHTPSGAIEPI